MQKPSIGIVAPASVISKTELKQGLEKLQKAGYSIKVHPSCYKKHLFFAGNDAIRAKAFYEQAKNKSLSILWCARGGYGAFRLLPWLEKMSRDYGIPPKKLLIGYSDITALHEFVHSRWGWKCLHAPMPGLKEFCNLNSKDWKTLRDLIEGIKSWTPQKLKFLTPSPKETLTGKLTGGNLSVLASLAGTPYAPRPNPEFLFLEEVSEPFYKIDRMAQQLLSSGYFRNAKAILLGNFFDCKDKISQPSLRPLLSPQNALREIFGSIGKCLNIPVAHGLPVGHGPKNYPLPLGVPYQLTPHGELKFLDWK